MRKLKMMLFGASLIMVVGCSSKENALCHPQPTPPQRPPAWAMMHRRTLSSCWTKRSRYPDGIIRDKQH